MFFLSHKWECQLPVVLKLPLSTIDPKWSSLPNLLPIITASYENSKHSLIKCCGGSKDGGTYATWDSGGRLHLEVFTEGWMNRNSPGDHFRHQKRIWQSRITRPTESRLISIPTINTLILVSIKVSLAFILVFSAPVFSIFNWSPRRLIFSHSLPRLYVTDKLKYSPTYFFPTWKTLNSLSAYQSSTHHSPL